MANVRDSDTSLWLHNKLGTSNDSWTGGSICSQLNAEVLRNIKDCFPDLQTQVKTKLLLSFFHIPRRNVEEWRVELEEILEVAQMDSEQWVSMLAEIMKTLPSTGSLNTDIKEVDENRRIFSDLINDLKKLVRKHSDTPMLPLECKYLNKSVLGNIAGSQTNTVKHFTLKRKPKSAALRAELLQRSADAASNIKKSTAPIIPVRSRGMPRKMTDTTPLKGIPSRLSTGGMRSSFLSPSVAGSSAAAIRSGSLPSGSAAGRTLTAGRKDGGIKLLDIAEQPLGYAQAKKRKRMQDLEEANKKAAAAAAAAAEAALLNSNPDTPDYAAGLLPSAPVPSPAPVPIQQGAERDSLLINNVNVPKATAPKQVVEEKPVAKVQTQVAQPASVPSAASSAPSLVTSAAAATAAATATTPTVTTTKKGLSLTREQMLEAQVMFRSANKVTRPEKALILGFMAGSRENPCPDLGNIVTIKLSENQENVMQQDNTFVPMMAETHFQMNYNTGEWKRIKKFRKMDDAPTTQIVVKPSPAIQQMSIPPM